MSTSPATSRYPDPDESEGEGLLHSTVEEEGGEEEEEEEEESLDDRPELGHLAQWTVSSHKYGFGVENLRDSNENTFWQSEGPQPHVIDLSFPKRVLVTSIAMLTSHPRDDSYTPSKISLRAGTGVHDLQEVRLDEFEKPDGWIVIPLRHEGDGPPIPCHHLRVVIIANHMNGKDTHVRGLRVYGASPGHDGLVPAPIPDDDEHKTAGRKLLELGHDANSGFKTSAFRMHEFIR